MFKEINLNIKADELVGIFGKVGSDKTSLLMPIVGELKTK